MNITVAIATGMTVGELTVISVAEPREINSGRKLKQWLCECSCGRQALRVEAALIYAIRNKRQPCCRVCAEELRRGFFADSKERRRTISRSVFSGMMVNTGSMYSVDSVNHGSCDSDVSLPLIVSTYSDDSPGTAADPPQQNQWMFSMSCASGWICATCGKPFTNGYGCVRCLGHACGDCYGKMAHVCAAGWERSFDNEKKDAGLLERRLTALSRPALRSVRVSEKGRMDPVDSAGSALAVRLEVYYGRKWI